jgi:UDP-glucose 4-epimerase
MRGHDTVIHLASNPDIARAATEPDIDFREGTLLSNNVVEAMRRSGTLNILYASGSGIYGDLGE